MVTNLGLLKLKGLEQQSLTVHSNFCNTWDIVLCQNN